MPDESKNSIASASIPVAGLNISQESNTGIIPQLQANRFLAGDASQEVNIPTLIPENNESLILPNTSLTLQKTDFSIADVSITVTNLSVDSLTGQAMQKVDKGLKTLATDLDFTQKDVSTIVTDSSVDSLTGQVMPKVDKKIKKLTADQDFTEKMDKKDKTSAATNGERHLLQADIGPFTVQGSIGYFYDKNPNIAKDLGQPTGREYQFPPGGKWRQNFQNGAIFHSANGTFSVHGSLGNYYLNVLRGQDSQLGLPTSEESYTGNGNWQQRFENGVLSWLNNGTAQVQLNGGNASLIKFGNLSGNERNLPGTVIPYPNPFANISNTTPERWSGTAGEQARYIQDSEMPVVANTRYRSADQIRQVIDYFNVEDPQNLRYKPNGWNTFCNIFATDVMRALRAPLPHWTLQGKELDANGVNDWLNNSANGWKKVTAQDATKAASQGIPTVGSWKNVGGIGHIAVVRPEAGPSPDNPQIAQAGAKNWVKTTVSTGFGQTKNVSYFAYYA